MPGYPHDLSKQRIIEELTYVILLVFGFIGLFVMAMMGSLRVGRGHHGALRGIHRGGHGLKGAHVSKGPHLAKGSAKIHGQGNKMSWLMQGFSPIDLMAMAMGAGAMGVIGRKVFHSEAIAAGMAVGGAFVIDFLIVRPLFSFLLKFASEPSSGLEGMISHVAEAATSFDQQGRGLIKLNLDGQTSQILATLDSGEHASGVTVKKGDALVVLEVDATRNVCRVSREIASHE